MKGWKVLEKHPTGHWCSAVESMGLVLYRENEWTEPKTDCGPLCVFSSREAAWSMMRGVFMTLYCVVRPCEYEPSPETSVWAPDYGYYDDIKRSMPLESLAPGTVLASRVKILPADPQAI